MPLEAMAAHLSEADTAWMRAALEEAQRSGGAGEVPIGAVLVCGDRILARGRNEVERLQDPTAHAEIVAIRCASVRAGSKRLLGTTLYVTLEPCAMCAGAVVLARIPRLVFGAFDPKTGACGSLRNVVQDPRLNHRCELLGGVLQEECGELLKGFFAGLRQAEPSGP